MLMSYAQKIDAPLSIYLFDSAARSARSFMENGARARGENFDPHTVLSLAYDGQARVNGKASSACMVQYLSPNREDFFRGYIQSGLTEREIIFYLAAHEFGHCMVFHRETLSAGRDSLGQDQKAHELIADKVAAGFLYASGGLAGAQKVVALNRRLDPDSIHYHPDALMSWIENFHAYMKDKHLPQTIGTMADLLEFALQIPDS